jgi:hypothetical protein
MRARNAGLGAWPCIRTSISSPTIRSSGTGAGAFRAAVVVDADAQPHAIAAIVVATAIREAAGRRMLRVWR